MKYYPVNWIDGMKINKDHFIDEQKAIINVVSELSFQNVNEYNFGLLRPLNESNSPVKFWIDIENDNSVHATISKCIAVTRGGHFINFSEIESSPAHYTVANPSIKEKINSLQEGVYFVAITVNPYVRIPFGTINPEEEPPRYPYTAPEYKLKLFPAHTNSLDYPDPNIIIVGKLKLHNGSLHQIEDYIPPCRSINSHPSLVDIHATLMNQLAKLETVSIGIVQKILQKDQQFPLARLVQVIAENIIFFLNNHMFNFRWVVKSKPPVEMVSILSQLGRTIKNTIDIYQGTGKDELLIYFVEWCDLNQSQFEGVIAEVVNLEYKHNDIRASMDRCLRFMKEVVTLFQKLSELEYIGRKTEKTLLVKEEQIKKENQSKTRISFFER